MSGGFRWLIALAVLLGGILCVPVDQVPAARKKPQRTVVVDSLRSPEVYLMQPPLFLRPDGEEYFVAIEVPYDLFYLVGSFYLLHRGTWFGSDFFEGPWERLGANRVPMPLRQQRAQALRDTRQKTAARFANNRAGWPPEALFIPEHNDGDAGNEENRDDEPAGGNDSAAEIEKGDN